MLAHEFGHFFGLDHSQIDSAQGMAQNNYVLMYPIAYRTLDLAARGRHGRGHRAVPVRVGELRLRPAHRHVHDGGAERRSSARTSGRRRLRPERSYSVVSDFLTQGNGYFRLLLPAGTYTLRAESIDSGFTGGSGVGPYSNASNDVSFQPPHPIAPVALGGASPQQIAITPGCLATAAFRLNGTGSVSGNCGSGPAAPAPTTTALASSANPAAVGAPVTFTATVAGAAPTGTVNFKDSGTTIAGCAAVPLGAARTAACSTSALVAGVHSIVAAYSGDAANAASTSSALSQVINSDVAADEHAGERRPGHRTLGGSQYGTALHVGRAGWRLEPQVQDQRGQRQREPLRAVRLAADDHGVRLPAPISPGSNETCAFFVPETGTYNVMVRSVTAFAGVTLTATFK